MNELKKFNQTISIEVEVDAIANQLQAMFKDDANFSNLVVEAIIGRSLSKDTVLLSKLMSAMNGYSKEIGLWIGEKYPVKNLTDWGYWTQESKEKKDTVRGEVLSVTVVDINEYSDEPVKVHYDLPTLTGTRVAERWISLSHFSI
jgi:hypothetical protein